jgi:hypothetical protein
LGAKSSPYYSSVDFDLWMNLNQWKTNSFCSPSSTTISLTTHFLTYGLCWLVDILHCWLSIWRFWLQQSMRVHDSMPDGVWPSIVVGQIQNISDSRALR